MSYSDDQYQGLKAERDALKAELERFTTGKRGHAKWVKTMTAKKLPAKLRDVSTSKWNKKFIGTYEAKNKLAT